MIVTLASKTKQKRIIPEADITIAIPYFYLKIILDFRDKPYEKIAIFLYYSNKTLKTLITFMLIIVQIYPSKNFVIFVTKFGKQNTRLLLST